MALTKGQVVFGLAFSFSNSALQRFNAAKVPATLQQWN
jgi:hypothetical protein